MKKFLLLSFLFFTLSHSLSAQTDSMALKGTADAKANYIPITPAVGGWVSGFFTPLGVFPMLAIGYTKPKEASLRAPYPDLMLNHSYRDAYVKEAYKKKQNWTGTGYLISAIPITIVSLILAFQ